MKLINKNNKLAKIFSLMLVFAGAQFLTACSSSSTPAAIIVVDADPKGYYTGTASVKDDADTNDVIITDLKGMVSGNDFTFFSVTEDVLYVGTITNIDGDDYIADVSIYTEIGMNWNSNDMPVPVDTTITGTINEGVTLSGTFEGSGPGNGTFTLTYSLDNSTLADSANIDVKWQGDVNGQTDMRFIFTVDAVGALTVAVLDEPNSRIFTQCNLSGVLGTSTITPIANESLYSANLIMSACADTPVDGTYTGFAFFTSANTLVLTFSNGRFGGYTVMTIL